MFRNSLVVFLSMVTLDAARVKIKNSLPSHSKGQQISSERISNHDEDIWNAKDGNAKLIDTTALLAEHEVLRPERNSDFQLKEQLSMESREWEAETHHRTMTASPGTRHRANSAPSRIERRVTPSLDDPENLKEDYESLKADYEHLKGLMDGILNNLDEFARTRLQMGNLQGFAELQRITRHVPCSLFAAEGICPSTRCTWSDSGCETTTTTMTAATTTTTTTTITTMAVESTTTTTTIAESSNTSFSVLTYNIWGAPRPGDKGIRLDRERVRRTMTALREEVLSRNPSVVAFQEYNNTAFDGFLEPLWERYSNCPLMSDMVRIGVRKDVTCDVAEREVKFSHRLRFSCPRGRGARSYQAVKIKVNNEWITVAGLHLMSGGQDRHSDNAQCRRASLGYSFSRIAAEKKRGIVMGDMNWFGRLSWRDRVRQEDVQDADHFDDAGLTTDNHAITYPAKEPNPKSPTHKFASRLDRVFYTKDGLKATALALVNRRLENSPDVSDSYHFISDHVGLHVTFEVLGRLRRTFNGRSTGPRPPSGFRSLGARPPSRPGRSTGARGRGGARELDDGGDSMYVGARVRARFGTELTGVYHEGDEGTVMKISGGNGNFEILWDLTHVKSNASAVNWQSHFDIIDDVDGEDDEEDAVSDEQADIAECRPCMGDDDQLDVSHEAENGTVHEPPSWWEWGKGMW